VISQLESLPMIALQYVELRLLNPKIQCLFNGMDVIEC